MEIFKSLYTDLKFPLNFPQKDNHMFTKVVEYIYDLSGLKSMTFVYNPKLIITIENNCLYLKFWALETNQQAPTKEAYSKTIILHEKFFVEYTFHTDSNTVLSLEALPHLSGQTELKIIKQILFTVFIAKNEYWFKENIPELYDEFVFHYSHLSKY